MDFLLDKLSNNLDTVSFLAGFDKKLNKKEQNFLIFLMNELEKKGIDNKLELGINYIINNLDFKTTDETIKVLNKFVHKYIEYSFVQNESQEIIIGGFFPIISSVKYTEDEVLLTLAEEIIESYKVNSIFNKVHLNTLIRFKLSSSMKLYQELIKYIDVYSSFEISLEKIKELFQMTDSYGRFYDFEKNILSLAIDEINTFSEYHIDYEKIKNGDGKTNRIISLKFFFYNKHVEEIQKNANELMSLIKEKVNNFDLILSAIQNHLESFDYKYVKDNLVFSLEHYEGDFDSFFIDALENNYVSTHFELKTREADKKYNLLIDVAAHFSNIFKLESELYKQLSKLKFHYDFEFVSVLHQLKTKNTLEFSNEQIKVFVEFNKNGDSYIKIYNIN